MRNVLSLTAGLVCLLPAAAQDPAPKPAPPTPVYQLGDVGRSMGLTTDQIERLNEVTTEAKLLFNKAVEKLGPLDDAERFKKMTELTTQFKANWDRSAREVFTDEQAVRNRQLDLKIGGFKSFLDPTVQQQMNLSADQVSALRGQVEANQQQLAAIKAVGNQDAVKGGKLYADYLIEQKRRMDLFLSPSQARAWQQLSGPAYTLQPGFYGR